MEKYFLEECCEILDSKRIPITEKDRTSGQYPYYGANGVQDYVDGYIFDDELVLLAEDGGNFGSKERPIAYRVSGKCWVNNHAHVLKPKKMIDVDYLCYSLMYYNVGGMVNGATRQKLTQAAMRKMQIPKLNMGEQLEIVLRLKRIQKIINGRNEQLQLLDNLIKSGFVEMFGNLFLNTLKWDEKTIDELCIEIVDCVNRTAPLSDKQTPYKMIRTSNIQNGKIDTINVNCVEKDVYEKWIRRLKPEKGDVLFTREAPTGNVGLVENNEKIFLGQRIMHYRPNQECINSYYLVMSLMSTDIDRQINKISTGSTVKHLSVDDCKKFAIKVPPMDLQNQFAAFVQQVNKLKVEALKSLAETQKLFDSLMQTYF